MLKLRRDVGNIWIICFGEILRFLKWILFGKRKFGRLNGIWRRILEIEMKKERYGYME